MGEPNKIFTWLICVVGSGHQFEIASLDNYQFRKNLIAKFYMVCSCSDHTSAELESHKATSVNSHATWG